VDLLAGEMIELFTRQSGFENVISLKGTDIYDTFAGLCSLHLRPDGEIFVGYLLGCEVVEMLWKYQSGRNSCLSDSTPVLAAKVAMHGGICPEVGGSCGRSLAVKLMWDKQHWC
jgi:hypothetical protein